MPQRLHHNEILDRLINLIDTAQAPAPPTGLGLKTIAKGDLSFYAGKDGLTAELPAVFIKPVPATELSFRAVGKEYEVRYQFRLVYVRSFATTDKVEEQQLADMQKLVETLIDNITLNDLALSNAQLTHSLPASIEWEPIEDEFVAGFNLWFRASAVAFTVVVLTRR